jgi:hypothetical protein
MAEELTAPLDVQITDQQLASLLGQAPTTFPRLLVVREIEEDENGATLSFQQGMQGRLALRDASSLQLARRSQQRQHPVGVSFGEVSAILELIRADNDVPTQLCEEPASPDRVLFQGHDGIFLLKTDHPEFARIRAVLDVAIRHKVQVWFITQKPDLALLDVLPAEGAVEKFQISFVVAPDHLLSTADELLRFRIRCARELRRDIRVMAKAYIDEADELKRAVREIQTNAARIQIASLSPPDIIEKAKRLRTVQFPNEELQEKVRAVANSYLLIAEKNQQHFDEFKEKYRDKLPPKK